MPYVGAMSRKSRPDEPKTQGHASGRARRPLPDDAGADKPETPERPDPTRYGDWEIGGRCIDF